MDAPPLDTRLYVSVRPALEHTLPRLGAAARAGMLGVVAEAARVPALMAALVPPAGSPEPASLENLAPDEGLRAAVDATLAALEAYLEGLAEAWLAHLRELRLRVGRVTDRVQREGTDEHASPADLLDVLNAGLEATARAASPPTAVRPPELRASAERLRAALAEAHRVHPSRRLLPVCRRTEEGSLALQRRVATRFLHGLRALLEDDAPPPKQGNDARASSGRAKESTATHARGRDAHAGAHVALGVVEAVASAGPMFEEVDAPENLRRVARRPE